RIARARRPAHRDRQGRQSRAGAVGLNTSRALEKPDSLARYSGRGRGEGLEARNLMPSPQPSPRVLGEGVKRYSAEDDTESHISPRVDRRAARVERARRDAGA